MGIVSAELQKTLELLSKTANEAAVPLLIAGLDSPSPVIRESSLDALLERRRSEGQAELIRRWDRLSDRWKQRIAQHPRQIASAVRDAILSRDAKLCANGCQAVLGIGEFELIPVLVNTLEDPRSPSKNIVAETLIGMCELLREEISGSREIPRIHQPMRIRDGVLPSLERTVDRYEQHRDRVVIESFLILTNHDNPLLTQILHDPRHPAYLVVQELMGNSPREAIIRLVLNLMESRFPATMAIHAVAHRCDSPFVKQLLARMASGAADSLCAGLRRVDSIAWLQGDLGLLDTLTEQEQEMTVKLALASNMDRIQVFNVLRHVMEYGHARGRRAASRALSNFGGAEANELVLEGLRDPDPEVQANMAVQLRERGIPGAMSHLIRLLDSPRELVAEAAKTCLREFNFDRYTTVFDVMGEDVRRSTGLLVKRIDPTTFGRLAEELKSPLRTQRLRGLKIAVVMEAVKQMEPLIIGLLKDEDYFVRAEAARTLAHLTSPLVQQSLRGALMDRSVMVREAAEESLRHHADPPRQEPATRFVPAESD